MVYLTETVSSLGDLITKVNAFLVANGWTSDELNLGTGIWAVHKTSVYFSARWATAGPNNLGIYHALGYTPGQVPGNHPSDSGNGAISGTDAGIFLSRHCPVTNTPVRYYGFTAGSTFHIAVQVNATPSFVHFGAGIMDKVGTWTGGEYAYGQRNPAVIAPTSAAATFLLDGLMTHAAQTNGNLYAATIHLEGLPGQGGTGKWGVCLADDTPGVDRAAVARVLIQGGFRGGPIAHTMARFEANPTKGLTALYPILQWYRRTNATGDVYPLGHMLDVRGVSLRNLVGADEIVSGSDTWMVFPTIVRSTLFSPGNTTQLQGIAYRKAP